ncbi:MAG: hypothetical protein KAR20_19290 [Candidatus Heimdallarchaeota archaeon]|nr:hypothetical protein [Candidatus Heimdallarchaeota archaeon]
MCKERMMNMPIVTYTEYWPAKFLGSDESEACAEHEIKLYGLWEKKLKELGIELLTNCGQWDGNTARVLAVLKVPPQHLNDFIKDIAQRNTIYFKKMVGFDTEFEIWANNEEMNEIFKDEPFYIKQQKYNQKLREKYGTS